MVWPTANIPTYGRGVWLECNGQSFSTTQFPQLYQTLGTNRVPDYQGMFLRGYGSQSYSQNNGSVVGHTSKTYSSSPVGTIQGDATMKWESYGAWGVGDHSHSFDQLRDMFGPKYPIQDFTFHSKQGYIVSSPQFYDDQGPDGFYPLKDIMAGAVEGPYKYRLEYTMSTDEDGNTTISDINLIEEDLMFSFPTQRVFQMPSDSSRIFPTANEFRPVNVAVKFMIKAK